MRGARLWLVVLLPWVVLALAGSLQPTPSSPGVTDLRGAWQWAEASDKGPPPVQPEAWKPLVLPGFFLRQGIGVADLWLRRQVTVGHVDDGPSMVVLGDTRSAVLRLFVNGVEVGDAGAFATGQKAEFNALDGIVVPTGLVRVGPNLIEVRVRSPIVPYAGINDQRFVLGPAAVLMPWYLRTHRLEVFLRTGPLMVLLMLSALLVVLARQAATGRERKLTLLALGLACTSALYLVIHSGIGLTGVVELGSRFDFVLVGILGPLATFLEFTVELVLGRTTWVVRANRLFTAVALMVLAVALVLGRPWSITIWRVFSPWIFIVFIYIVVIGIRAIRKTRDISTAMLLSTVATFVFAGFGDTLADLGLLQWPRLFAISLVNAPLLTGLVVVIRFLGLADRNRSLTESLGKALIEAHEATRVKSEFLAKISHELRTPLNAIINIPEGLMEEFEEDDKGARFVGDAGQTRRFLGTVHRSGMHLLGVVNQVLDFSKLEVGNMTLQIERIDLALLLAETVRSLETMALARGVKLVISGESQGSLWADRAKVSHLLSNLGNNAIKFSSDNSVVEFRVGQTKDAVEFSVKDSGIGIAVEHQALIFESFRQVEGSSTRRFGGTGLGLAIARKLAELHGGTLTLTSAPHKGSTFVARIRQQPPPDEDRAVPASRWTHQSGEA
jgi:signal transduction histidine kinase